jgi:hypothetical protein
MMDAYQVQETKDRRLGSSQSDAEAQVPQSPAAGAQSGELHALLGQAVVQRQADSAAPETAAEGSEAAELASGGAEPAGQTQPQAGQTRDILSLQCGLMPKPQFLGTAIQLLKRGEQVLLLRREGSWWFVRTQEKTEGFVHERRIYVPKVVLRPGETGSGNTREGTSGGGRA